MGKLNAVPVLLSGEPWGTRVTKKLLCPLFIINRDPPSISSDLSLMFIHRNHY